MQSDSHDEPLPGRRTAAHAIDIVVAATAAVAIAALFGYRTYQFWAYAVDDAFITFREARNLVNGGGLAYNAGGKPVEAFTSAMALLIAAAAGALNLSMMFWTRVAGLAGWIATIAGSILIARDLLRWNAVPAGALSGAIPLAGAAYLVISVSLATGAVACLETTLFAGLVTMSALLFLRLAAGEGDSRLAAAAGAIAGAMCWTRPEGIAWAVGLTGASAVVAARHRHPVRLVLTAGAMALLAWATLVAIRLSVFGLLHPNPYYAKMGHDTAGRIASGAGYVGRFLSSDRGWLLVAGAACAVACSRGAARWLAAMAFAGVLGHLAVTIYEGGDWIPHLRFVAPCLGVLAALFSAGLGLICLRALPARMTLPVSGAATLAAAAAMAILLWNPNKSAVAEIQTRVFGWADAHIPLGRWLGKWNDDRLRKGGPRLLVALEDIGYVGWISDANIVDLAGLADPSWARIIYESRARAPYPVEALLALAPDAVILVSGAPFAPEAPNWFNTTNQAIGRSDAFHRLYVPCAIYAHKHFPGDGYYLHLFLRRDVARDPPDEPDPPTPRATVRK